MVFCFVQYDCGSPFVYTGKISIELSFFKSFIALYSSVVILEGGGLALVFNMYHL